MTRVWICDLLICTQNTAVWGSIDTRWAKLVKWFYIHLSALLWNDGLMCPTWQWPMMMAMTMTIVAWPLLWSFSNAGYRVGEAVGLWMSLNEKNRRYGIFRTPTVQSHYSIFHCTTLSLVAFLSLRVFRRDWVSSDTSIWILVACLSQAKWLSCFHHVIVEMK